MSETGLQQTKVGDGGDIRPGQRADAEPCAAMLNRWIDTCAWMPRVHTPQEVVDYFRDTLFRTRQVFVAGRDPKGFVAIDPEQDLLTDLFVDAPGQGIGSHLLNHVKAGRDRLRLWTFVANRGARRFYEREGFREVRRTDGENDEGLPDILFQWVRA